MSGKLRIILSLLVLFLVFRNVASQQDLDFARRLYEDGIYLQAAEELRSFVRNYPDDPKAPSAQLLLAESYFKAGLTERALEEYESFILQRPDDTDVLKAWAGRAECLLTLDRFIDAGETYIQAQRIYPFSSFAPEALLKSALNFRKGGDLQKASEALDILLKNYPESKYVNRARYDLGLTLKQMGRLDESLENLSRVDRSSEEGSGALLASIEILLSKGNLDGAKRVFTELKSGFPNSDGVGKALLFIGSYMIDESRFAEGIVYLEEGSGFRGELATEAKLKLGWAYRSLGRDSLAANAFGSLLSQDISVEDRASAMLGLSKSFVSMGNYGDAIGALRELSEMEGAPTSYRLDALEALGEAYRRSENYHMAVGTYQLSADRSDDPERSARILYSIGKIYEDDLKWPEQAAYYYSRLAAGSSQYSPKALLSLARCWERVSDLEKALTSYGEFLRRFPDSPEAEDVARKVDLAQELGSPDYQKASEKLLDVLSMSLEGSEGELLYRLCRIRYDELRDFEGAAMSFSEYLKLYPSGKFAPESYYFLAESYGKIALVKKADGDSSGFELAIGKATDNYNLLYKRYPKNKLADDAFIKFTEAKVRSIESDSARFSFILKSYTDFMNRFISSNRLDYALLRVGDAYSGLARMDTTYLQQGISIYRRILEQFPESTYSGDATFGLGMAYLRSGDRILALNSFSKFATEYRGSPHSREARFQMAKILISMGKYDEALRHCKWLLNNRYPDMPYPSLLELTASIYESQDRWDEARKMYEEALAIPSLSRHKLLIIRRIARSYEMSGSTENALVWYKRYMDMLPEGGLADSVLITVGKISRDLGDMRGASQALESLIAEFPESPLVPGTKVSLAELYCENGNHNGAISLYRELAKEGVSDVRVAKGFIVCLLGVGRVKEAGTEFAKFSKKFGKDRDFEARFLYEKGLLYEERKDYAQAISSFDAVVKKFGGSPYADDALYHVGLAHYLGDDIPKAVEVFSSLLKENPESEYVSDACMKLGNIYYSSGRLADAAYYYRKVFSLDGSGPLAPDAMWNAILSYEALGLFEDALGLCRELMERFPGYEKVPRIEFKIGFFLMELGKYRDAIAQFDKCLVGADRETEAEVRFHIAECYFSLGDYSRAVSNYLKIAYMNRDQMLWAVTAEYKAGMTYERMAKLGEARKLYRRMVAYYGPQSEWGRAASERLSELDSSSEGKK